MLNNGMTPITIYVRPNQREAVHQFNKMMRSPRRRHAAIAATLGTEVYGTVTIGDTPVPIYYCISNAACKHLERLLGSDSAADIERWLSAP